MNTKEIILSCKESDYRDDLTHLYNQGFLEAELSRMNGGRQYPISIIMIDIDGLRKVNEERGSEAGDELICCTVTLLQGCFRPDEIIARVGGEEFIVLLPNTSLEPARTAVARVRRSVVEYNLEMPLVRMSLSIGFATANEGEDLRSTMNLVKGLMLQDKRSKR